MTAVVSGTTFEGPKTIGFRRQGGNERIVIDRRKRVENEGDSLHGTKPETVARGRIRVTQNPEDAGQKHAAVCGMNGAQHAVAGHVAEATGLAGGQAQRLENSRDVDTHEDAGVSAGSAGRVKLAAQAQENATQMPPRTSKLGYPAGQTAALQGGVVDRPGLRRDLPCKSGERAENPIRAGAAGATGEKDTGRELGQVGRTRPPRPRARSAKRHDQRTGSGSDTRRRRSIGSSGRTPDGRMQRRLRNRGRPGRIIE